MMKMGENSKEGGKSEAVLSRTGGIPHWPGLCGSHPGALYHVTSRGNDKKDIFRVFLLAESPEAGTFVVRPRQQHGLHVAPLEKTRHKPGGRTPRCAFSSEFAPLDVSLPAGEGMSKNWSLVHFPGSPVARVCNVIDRRPRAPKKVTPQDRGRSRDKSPFQPPGPHPAQGCLSSFGNSAGARQPIKNRKKRGSTARTLMSRTV